MKHIICNKFNLILISLVISFSVNIVFSAEWEDTDAGGSIDIVDALLVAQYSIGLSPRSVPCGSTGREGGHIV